MSRPDECPMCDRWTFRNGRCSHCGHEEVPESVPSPWPDPDQREVGLRGVDQTRDVLNRKHRK